MNTTEPTEPAPDRHEASRPSLEQMLVEDAHFAGDLEECDNRKLLWLAMQTKAWKGTEVLGKDAAILAEIESRLYPEYDGDKVKATEWGWDVCGGEVRYALDHAAQEQQPKPNRPTIVCLVGSSRFYKEYQEAEYRETMAGKIYLSIGFYPHAAAEMHGEGVGHNSAEKVALDELHKRKIDLADEVLVLNVGGYIGDSTRSEIAYAVKIGKPIRWLEGEAQEQPAPPDMRQLLGPECPQCGAIPVNLPPEKVAEIRALFPDLQPAPPAAPTQQSAREWGERVINDLLNQASITPQLTLDAIRELADRADAAEAQEKQARDGWRAAEIALDAWMAKLRNEQGLRLIALVERDDLRAQLAAAQDGARRLREALRIIQWNGGGHTDEGLSCNGSWCAEQARAALAAQKEGAK